MRYWHYEIDGQRLRMEATHKGRKPAKRQIGDKAWQIRRAVVIERNGRLEQL